jgi:exosortase E/protease (VPEID-CTERM system)
LLFSSLILMSGRSSDSLFGRFLLLALLYALEVLALSWWLDLASLRHASGFPLLIHVWGDTAVRFAAGAAVLFALLGSRNAARAPRSSVADRQLPRFGWGWLAAHFLSMALFLLLSRRLFAGTGLVAATGNLSAGAWLVAGIAAIPLAALAFAPVRVWRAAARATGSAWIYAAAAGLAASLVTVASRKLWGAAIGLTFFLVKIILRGLVPGLIANAATATVGTASFDVVISPACSGLEGIGLILAFGGAWLWAFRREFRFPQALLLLPAGVGLIFVANALRIAALVLIGIAGAPAVALGGFHSQAGWLAFLAIAVCGAVAAPHIAWVTARNAEVVARGSVTENPTAAYLVPFLAILAASMVSRAASSGFEWLYALRFFAAAAALWHYRRHYKALDWRCGGLAAAIGGLVFLLWIALDGMRGVSPAAMPAALAALSPSGRVAWIGFRVLAAVATVPIAEELAFRGFLMRRFVAADFASIQARAAAWGPVLLSSLAFGALHGARWPAGAVAGLLYAAAFRRRGRIGDAAMAHAVTNALLAVFVLFTGNWSLW